MQVNVKYWNLLLGVNCMYNIERLEDTVHFIYVQL